KRTRPECPLIVAVSFPFTNFAAPGPMEILAAVFFCKSKLQSRSGISPSVVARTRMLSLPQGSTHIICSFKRHTRRERSFPVTERAWFTASLYEKAHSALFIEHFFSSRSQVALGSGLEGEALLC